MGFPQPDINEYPIIVRADNNLPNIQYTVEISNCDRCEILDFYENINDIF